MDDLFDKIKTAIQSFRNKEVYFTIDITNFGFFRKYPDNKDKLVVTEKISAVNEHLISLSLVPVMADHIIQLNIDKFLTHHDISVVEKMAAINDKENDHLKYFTSVYCNYHHPAIYPVYSERNKEMLLLYTSAFSNEGIHHDDLNDYETYKKITDAFCNDLQLTRLDYHELNKFLWIQREMITAGLKAIRTRN